MFRIFDSHDGKAETLVHAHISIINIETFVPETMDTTTEFEPLSRYLSAGRRADIGDDIVSTSWLLRHCPYPLVLNSERTSFPIPNNRTHRSQFSGLRSEFEKCILFA
ncbi:hypothetical protein CEXT_264441 [Caerostris extrusa]|uniref:Uncharacterized protein n=1 Tax=Caerostris extrusa TaxID=172846 RepID=A0AAV4QJI6_CAEEX|nr:hypothetical protein CEXT_264441 [Caerostris extrusa]